MQRSLVLGALAALAALALVGVAGADGTPLQGSVGPSYTISLKDAAGVPVTHLDPGAYALTVNDLGDDHSFHLQGPGTDVGTDIEGTGTKTFALNLVDGVYRFFCDQHPSRMHGTFTVGSATLPPPPPTPKPKPAPGRLTLTVTDRAVSLRKGTAVVRTLAAGAYVVRVADRSSRQNAHLVGAGVNRRTGIPFVGSVTWKVTLEPGALAIRSDGLAPRPKPGKVAVS